ncbi:hypothetical protein Tco_0187152, partial [Tanacetum coccineum]
EDAIAVRQGEERVVSEQPKKVKRKRLKQSDALPAKKLRTDKFISKASSFFIKSISAVRSVGMPISAGMTASVPYVSKNGVSPLLDLIIDAAEPANDVIPYELLYLISRDSRDMLCLNPFGEVINDNN